MNVKAIDHKDPILEDVILLGKKNANKLGLFPRDAFVDHAKKKWIIVAEKNGTLLGYILFRIPQSKGAIYVAHLCINEDHRRGGVAKLLLDEIQNKYSRLLKGIGLSCRKDYEEASHFWKKYGFKPKLEIRSRSKQEKYLIKWWYDFGNHDLFSEQDYTSDKIKVGLDASIVIKLKENTETEINALLADWLDAEVDYYYAPELFNEIQRDKIKDRADATREFFTRTFKEAKCKPEKINPIISKLSGLFPGQSDNHISDKKQLAECIASEIEYFITTDKNILSNCDKLIENFNMHVMNPSEFILQIDQLKNRDNYQPARLAGVNCDIKSIESSNLNKLIEEFLRSEKGEKKHELSLQISQIISGIKNSTIKVIADHEGVNLGMTGSTSEHDSLILSMIRVKPSGLSATLFKQLVSNAILSAVVAKKNFIVITDQMLLDEEKVILMDYGFDQHGDCWRKTAIDWVGDSSELFPKNIWLENQIDMKLIQNKLRTIHVKEELDLYKYKIERKFWPLKLTDLDLPAYIIPIKPHWAGQLFDYLSSESTLFGSKPELIWNNENIYYRNVKPVSEISPGRILWYASSDDRLIRTNGIVGCSYLDEVYVDGAKKLFQKFKRYGTYEWSHVYNLAQEDVNKEIKALKFSDTELFNVPIGFNEVGEILESNGQKANTFASPVKISSSTFFDLYKKGINYD
jgi:GNAT superfamily N-acetyltransferase/predicted nucleic acid-binding protein